MLSIIVKVLSQDLQINLSTTHYELFILNVPVSFYKQSQKSRITQIHFNLYVFIERGLSES